MKKTKAITQIQTTTQTSTKVGVALLGLAAVSAAAGFVMASAQQPILVLTANRLPTAHSTVMGAQNEPILGIVVQAKNAPITINKLEFAAWFDSDGSMSPANNDLAGGDLVESCVLKNSRTGSVVAGPEAMVSNGNNLTFTDNIALPANSTSSFTVTCNLKNATATKSYIMALALIGDPSYITATKTGATTPLTPDRIYVGNAQDTGVNLLHSFVGPVTVTVREHGKISATTAADAPSGNIVIGNTTNNPVAKFTLSAINEAFTVKKLTIKNWGDDAAIKQVSIKYKNQSGTSVTKTGTLSNHFVQFSNLDMYVPSGASNAAKLDVSVDTKPVLTPYDSGREFGLGLDFSSPGSFQAVAATSGFTITESSMSNIQPWANFVLRKTRPTITLNSASPSGHSTKGRNEILRFNVSAASTGDVLLTNLKLDLSTTDVARSGWNSCGAFTTNGSPIIISDLTSGQTLFQENVGFTPSNLGCPADNHAVVDWVNLGLINNALHSDALVPAGTTHTFSIMYDTAGAAVGDTVRADITYDPYPPFPGVMVGLNWCDAGLQCTANSFSVKNLPLSGGTLIY